MADDAIRGLGLAHTMDAPHPPRQTHRPRTQATLLLHWTQYWEPQCILAAKHAHDFREAMQIYKESYDRRMATLLRAEIRWEAILSNDLDSPLQSGVEFDRGLALAIARRAARMGRRKGYSKGKVKVKRDPSN